MHSSIIRRGALALAASASLLLALTACATTAEATDESAAPSPAITAGSPMLSFPSADLEWTELPGSGGVHYANVSGELASEGPYEAFVRFPQGADNPFHTHSADLPTVVLAGTFYAEIDGERVEYGPGSYYNLPAGLEHYSGCTADAECLLFQYQTAPFDLNAVEENS